MSSKKNNSISGAGVRSTSEAIAIKAFGRKERQSIAAAERAFWERRSKSGSAVIFRPTGGKFGRRVSE